MRTARMAAAALALTVGAPWTMPAAGAEPAWETLEVSGVGVVMARPDIARARIDVWQHKPTLAGAVDAITAADRRIRDALASGGVSGADVRTDALGIVGASVRRGRAFDATESLLVTLRDVDRAPATAASVVRSGGRGTRVAVSYAIEDRQPYLARARSAAFADARTAAERAALAQGRRLGAARTVQEAEDRPGEAAPVACCGEQVPPPSRTTVSVHTTVVWRLLPLTALRTDEAPGTVTVAGESVVRRTPDYIRSRLWVRAWGADEDTASRRTEPAMNRIRAALKAAGVSGDHVVPEAPRLVHAYSRAHKGFAWLANRSVEVRLRDASRAERILTAAVRAGGDAARLDGFDGVYADQLGLLEEAVATAYGQADAAAQQYAHLTGRRLGEVESARPDDPGVYRLDGDAPTLAFRVSVTRRLE